MTCVRGTVKMATMEAGQSPSRKVNHTSIHPAACAGASTAEPHQPPILSHPPTMGRVMRARRQRTAALPSPPLPSTACQTGATHVGESGRRAGGEQRRKAGGEQEESTQEEGGDSSKADSMFTIYIPTPLWD